MHLELPALVGASVDELLELRTREPESFRRLQLALREALRLQAKASTVGSDAVSIAREIENDVIRPALTEIDRTLTRFEQERERKALRFLARTVVSVSIGLAASLISPLGMATAIAVIGRDVVDTIGSWTDGRPGISTDAYFILWKAREHSH